jgi:undecaprenyl pyrophosphate synthase
MNRERLKGNLDLLRVRDPAFREIDFLRALRSYAARTRSFGA